MTRIVYFLPILVFLGVGAYFAIGLTLEPSRLPSTLIDQPFPEMDLPPIEGFEEGLSRDNLKGQVSLVNIFGSWCVACLVEHPTLMTIAAREDVPLYGINWKDAPGAGAAWLKRHGNPYTRIGDDPDSRMAIDLGVTGAPETFVVDQQGRIRYKHVGPITDDVWQDLIAPIIERLRAS